MRDLKYLFAYTVPISTLISFNSFGIGTYTAVFYAFVILPILDVVLGEDNTNLSEEKAGLKKINKVLEGRPHIVDLMKNKEISLVVNTTEGRESITDSASIRRTALDQKICSSTTIEGARAICKVIENQVDWRVKKLQDIH